MASEKDRFEFRISTFEFRILLRSVFLARIKFVEVVLLNI